MLSQEEFPALSAQKQTSRQEQHVTRTTATTQRTNILTPDQADHLVSGITGHRLGNAAVGEGLVQVAVPPGETVAVSGSIEGQPIARTVVASQTALPVREMVIVGQTEEIVPATVVKKTTILAETQRIPTQTLVRQEVDRTSTLTETTKEISKEAVEIASKTAGMAIDATEAAASTVYNKTTEAGAFVRDTAASAAETAKETIKEGAEVVAEKAHDLTLGTAEMIGTGVGHVANVTEAAAEKAVNAAETVAEGTAEIVGGGAGLIVNTATGTAELAKDATLGAVHLVEGAAETLYDAGAAVANKAKEEFEAAEEIAHNIVIGTAEKIGAGAGHVANVAEAVTDTAYNVVTGTAELAKDVTLGAAHLTKDVTVGTVHLAENAVVGTAHLAKDVTVGTATLAKDITVGTVQKTAQVAGAGAGFLVNTATSIASTAAHVVTGTVSTVVGAASTAVEMAGDGASAVVQGVVGLGEAAKEKILSPAAEVIAKEEKIVEEKIAEDYSVYESVMKIEGKEIHKTEKKEKDIGIDLANPEGVVLTQGVRWSNLAVAEPPVTTVERVPAEIITERTTFIPPTGEIVTEKVGQITTGFTGLGPATVISSHTIPLTTERIEPDVEPQIIQQSFTGLAGQPQDQGITNLTSQVTAGTLAQGVITRDSFGQGQRVEQLRSEQEIVTGKNPVNGLPKTFSGALKEGLEDMPPVANLEEKSFATAVKEPIPQARNIHLEKKPLEADFLRGREEVRNMTALQTSRGGEDIYGYAPAHEAEHYAIENKDKIHESHPRAFEGEGHMPGYCPKGPSMAAPREKTWIASVQRDTSPKSGTGYITDESESAAEADSKWLDEGGASTELSDRLHGSELINKEERARHDSLMSDASWTTDTDFRDRTGSTKSALSFGSPIKEHMKTVDSDDEGIREEHEITSLDADLVMNIFPKSGEKAVLPIDNTIGKEAIPFEPVGPEGKIGAAPLPELV